MTPIKIFTEDLQIAQSILKRDGTATRGYMYTKCYPLFKSIYDNYHTDCGSVVEFISEIYLLVLTPSKETGKCQLENYRGESTLATWFKTAALFYCYHKYTKKGRLQVVDIKPSDEDNEDYGDRLIDKNSSTNMDTTSMDRHDLEVIIGLMPNERYQKLIRLRYLERMSNEETAEALGMTMANYYNKHKLAKAQFVETLKKEANYE